jgi:hypothetical protein
MLSKNFLTGPGCIIATAEIQAIYISNIGRKIGDLEYFIGFTQQL